MMIKPTAQGTRYWGKSELDGWLNWFVYRADEITDEQINEAFQPHNGGPGELFLNPVWIHRRTKTRVLVTQQGGYDC
jgi:hypothetical protein